MTGHCVQLKGPVDVHIGVGSAVERLPVYVADLDEPCLLGLEYLMQSKACVDLGRKLVHEDAWPRSALASGGRLCGGSCG